MICSFGFGIFLYVAFPTSDIPSINFEIGSGKEVIGSVGSRDVETSQHQDI